MQEEHPLSSRVGLTLISPAVWSWICLVTFSGKKFVYVLEALQEQSESYDGDTEMRTGRVGVATGEGRQ